MSRLQSLPARNSSNSNQAPNYWLTKHYQQSRVVREWEPIVHKLDKLAKFNSFVAKARIKTTLSLASGQGQGPSCLEVETRPCSARRPQQASCPPPSARVQVKGFRAGLCWAFPIRGRERPAPLGRPPTTAALRRPAPAPCRAASVAIRATKPGNSRRRQTAHCSCPVAWTRRDLRTAIATATAAAAAAAGE